MLDSLPIPSSSIEYSSLLNPRMTVTLLNQPLVRMTSGTAENIPNCPNVVSGTGRNVIRSLFSF